MKLLYIISIVYVYTVQSPSGKISDFFIENQKNCFDNGFLHFTLSPDIECSPRDELYTSIVSRKICALLESLKLNSDSVVTEILEKDYSLKKEKVMTLYRNRVIISSSLKRLYMLDKLDLSLVDFTSEAAMRNFYLKNNIMNESRLAQICFHVNSKVTDFRNLIVSVEIACIYLDIQDMVLQYAKEKCEGDSELGKSYGPDKVRMFLTDYEHLKYGFLNVKIDYYGDLLRFKSISILASPYGIRKTEIRKACNNEILQRFWFLDFIEDVKNDTYLRGLYKCCDVSQISKLTGHQFVCELALAEFLISVIHFYAEIYGVEIKYKIDLLSIKSYKIRIIDISKINE